jgi:hypothetical protein
MSNEVQNSANTAPGSLNAPSIQTWTFVAGTTGAVATHTLYTVTGRILVDLIAAFCTTTLTSGGTPAITVGTVSAIATLIPAPTGGAPGILTNDWWATAVSPQLVANPLTVVTGGTVVSSRQMLVAENIVLDVPTATVTGGVLEFYLVWKPLSANGNVVVTTPA